MVRDKYPLPIVEDQIDRLAEARVFSAIDLRNGFFHVNVETKSRRYRFCHPILKSFFRVIHRPCFKGSLLIISFSEYGLDINRDKRQLLQSRIEYLGHVIEKWQSPFVVQ